LHIDFAPNRKLVDSAVASEKADNRMTDILNRWPLTLVVLGGALTLVWAIALACVPAYFIMRLI
jgi:hypothetical protein